MESADPGVLAKEGDAAEETGVVDGVEGRRFRIGEVKVAFSLAVLILDKLRSISSMRSLTSAIISMVSVKDPDVKFCVKNRFNFELQW